ncbi:MAG: monovalent cation/H(+) antiporter subunit G [Candidatus Puniceispirillales bacterium]
MSDVIHMVAMVLIGLGGLALIVGAIGLVRLPDVYSRIHAAGIIDTAGVALMVLGMILLSPSWLITVKLVLIGIFIFFTSPISGHAIAQVARSSGIEPEARDTTKSDKGSRS